VVVAGSVEGNITAESRVELDSAAVVLGDIVAGSILTHEGAQIRGKVTVRTGDGTTHVQTEHIGSEAAREAATEAAAEAASLAETVLARAESPEERWVTPDGVAPDRPVRLSPPEEGI
jgi:hypothetical protein